MVGKEEIPITQDNIEILLVEDEQDYAERTMQVLNKCNFENKTFLVKDGQEALYFLFRTGVYSNQINENLPKLILLDLNLPKLHGMEVLKSIKADARTQKIPVIILTVNDENVVVRECFKLGADNYVIKSDNFDKFSEAISNRVFFWLKPE